MSMHLPRALEFRILADDWFQVKVDEHVFIYRLSSDRRDVFLHRVKRGGRRAHRASEHYEEAAHDFALREARARRLIGERETAVPRK